MSDDLFCTQHISQDQPRGGLTTSPNCVEEERVEVGADICVDVCLGKLSGPEGDLKTGEAKPEEKMKEPNDILCACV